MGSSRQRLLKRWDAACDDRAFDHPACEPYFALAEELDIPVGLHLGEGPKGAPYWRNPKYRARLTSHFQLEDVLLRVYVKHCTSPLVDEMIALMYAHRRGR